MTDIRGTKFYSATVMSEIRDSGFKQGADWMRNEIITMLNQVRNESHISKSDLIDRITKIDYGDMLNNPTI